MSVVHLGDTVFVRRSAADVFDYLADFRRAAEWRAEVAEAAMRPAGPMRLGSVLREVATIAGHRVVTESSVDHFDPPYRFTFGHVAGPLPMSGAYTVTSSPGGATVRYDVTLDLHGGWALLAPILRITMAHTIAESLDEFRFRLEASALPLAG